MCSFGLLVQTRNGAEDSRWTIVVEYTLLQKKCNLSELVFLGAPGSGSVIPGHVNCKHTVVQSQGGDSDGKPTGGAAPLKFTP